MIKDSWFHILIALADRDRHGSDIARDVSERTDGDVVLWPATLYGSLDELVGAGLITELTGRRRPPGSSKRRRYYAISDAGRTELGAALTRVEETTVTARRRLESRPARAG